MAGFLDKNTRILDMVLTNQGKALLSRGQLRFCYWIPYDDGICYDPYIAESGSMTAENLSSSIDIHIESTPMREATTGYREFNARGSDFTNVHRPMFTMAQGQQIVPRAVFPVEGERSITTSQRQVIQSFKERDEKGHYLAPIPSMVLGTERYDSSGFNVELKYGTDSFSDDFSPEGFRVQVFKSGSGGYVEVFSKNDLQNELCYGSDVRVFTGRRQG